MSRLALTLLALTACATDPVAEPDLDTNLPDGVTEPSGTLEPAAQDGPATQDAVRDLRISCGPRIDGVEEVRLSATSDRHVAFAFAQLRNSDASDTLELWTIDFGPNGIIAGGEIIHANEAVSSGKIPLGPASAFTCATLPEFGVQVVIAFETGAVACVTGGNATQAKSFVCQ